MTDHEDDLYGEGNFDDELAEMLREELAREEGEIETVTITRRWVGERALIEIEADTTSDDATTAILAQAHGQWNCTHVIREYEDDDEEDEEDEDEE